MSPPDPPTNGPPPSLPLASWLQTLAKQQNSEFLLGATGHLLLSTAEEENVTTQLRQGVLPLLFPPGWSGPVCLLTGLAPGSDLLFARVLSAWLLENKIPFRMAGLLPVPPETLLEDWLDSLRAAGEEITAAQHRLRREQIASSLAACDTVVDLLPPGGGAAELADRAFREQQYRRLAACLAQRSDLLVAILRQQNPLRPGGTAEVVDWRRHPRHIPAQFCTDPPPAPDGRGHRLIVIDPAVAYAPPPDSRMQA